MARSGRVWTIINSDLMGPESLKERELPRPTQGKSTSLVGAILYPAPGKSQAQSVGVGSVQDKRTLV
jgi:hypothetical protein